MGPRASAIPRAKGGWTRSGQTDWQKDYFQGRDAVGNEAMTHHMTKVKAPEVRGIPVDECRAPVDAGIRASNAVERGLSTEASSGARHDQSLEWLYSQSSVAIVMMGQEPDPEADDRAANAFGPQHPRPADDDSARVGDK